MPESVPRSGRDAKRLRDLAPQQWKSGIAAVLQSAVNCGVMLAMIFGGILLLPHLTIQAII